MIRVIQLSLAGLLIALVAIDMWLAFQPSARQSDLKTKFQIVFTDQSEEKCSVKDDRLFHFCAVGGLSKIVASKEEGGEWVVDRSNLDEQISKLVRWGLLGSVCVFTELRDPANDPDMLIAACGPLLRVDHKRSEEL